MFSQRGVKTTVQLAIASVFTALVCVATMSFTIYVPSTKGFFNIGETMVYLSALLFGPFVGALAGGVGSMFADILLGYYYYAPATLVIKALEGALVGFLSRKRRQFSESNSLEWKIFTAEIGVLIGALVSLLGFLYYSGAVEYYSGFPPSEAPTATIFIPVEFWFALGVVVTLLISSIGFISDPEYGWMVISTVFGGLLMVTGYFIYEQIFLGVFALVEVPVNIGQMTIGLIIATPIAKIVQRALPQLRS